MSILVLNSGSSSLKYKLFNKEDNSVLSYGELKNYDNTSLKYQHENKEEVLSSDSWDQRLETVLKHIDLTDIEAIIHRIVHGGEEFNKPTIIDSEVLANLKKNLEDLAPLHNPFAFEMIEKCIANFPNAKQIGVFDTSFGLTIPKENYLYALPIEYYERLKIRRYAFHGISHKFVSKSYHKYITGVQRITSALSPEIASKDRTRIVTVHLGSGCSTCAIKDTQCVDTSFGFTPEENIIMSTRVGEIDYSAVQMIKVRDGLSDNEISSLLNQKSGLLALSGYTKDMKVLLDDYNSNPKAKLTVDMFVNSVVKQILSMVNTLRGLDVLIFTGGIGQGSDIIRQMICERLDILEVYIDVDSNVGKKDVKDIINVTKNGSKSQIYIVPTNEELEMLMESIGLLS